MTCSQLIMRRENKTHGGCVLTFVFGCVIDDISGTSLERTASISTAEPAPLAVDRTALSAALAQLLPPFVRCARLQPRQKLHGLLTHHRSQQCHAVLHVANYHSVVSTLALRSSGAL